MQALAAAIGLIFLAYILDNWSLRDIWALTWRVGLIYLAVQLFR